MIFLLICYYCVICFFIIFLLNYLAHRLNHFEVNFNNKSIPIGSGLLIPSALIMLFPFVDDLLHQNRWGLYCFLTVILGVIGFIDDRFGNKHIKGIKGHLLHLKTKKQISSGLFKMLGIIITGFCISIFLHQSLVLVFVSTLIFSIWTNIYNFLDVRPTRAIKGFWLFFLIMLITHMEYIQLIEWLLLLLTVPLFLIDSFQKGMLGDAGSNILGGIVGFWIISFSTIPEMILLLLIGLMLTSYAERKSFSQWIEKHPLIQKIDRWGLKTSD